VRRLASILKSRRSLVAAAVLTFCSASCGTISTNQSKPAALETPSFNEVRAGMGISCKVDGQLGPPSYSVRDIGKFGVPPLTKPQLATLKSITHYYNPPTLRFAFVGREYVVFNPKFGLCWRGVPGYRVLNGGCNAYYAVTDRFDGTVAVPDCWGAPRPWVSADPGRGSAKEW